MRTKEGAIKEKVKKILAEVGAWYFMPSANGYGRSAIPDIICCVRGHFLAIECKADNLQPTAIQQRELNRIAESKGTGICVNAENVDKLVEHLRRMSNGEEDV